MTSSLTHTIRARLAALDAAPLVAFLAPAVLLLAFFGIADEMAEGDTHTLDRALLDALRTPGAPHDPVGPVWLDAAIIDLTSLGSTSVLTLITLLAIGFLMLVKRRGAALTLALAAAGGGLLSTLLKSTFERPRPEFIAHGVAIDAWSFPSGHAMLSAVIYLTLGALLTQATARRRLRLYIVGAGILLTLIVGASRVYLGVHYPSDVLAGWIIGAAWALGCRAAAAQFGDRDRAPAALD